MPIPKRKLLKIQLAHQKDLHDNLQEAEEAIQADFSLFECPHRLLTDEEPLVPLATVRVVRNTEFTGANSLTYKNVKKSANLSCYSDFTGCFTIIVYDCFYRHFLFSWAAMITLVNSQII